MITVKGDCQDIDGGDWRLVRHTYGEWFIAKDGMVGTEDYNGGCEDQDPLSTIACSTPFADIFVNNPTGKVMFSNGNCSQYLVTTYDQFAVIRSSPYEANIIESDISSEPYTAKWYARCTDCGDPWIGTRDHCSLSNDCMETLYAEDSTLLHTGRFRSLRSDDVVTVSLNVWIKNTYDEVDG